MRDNKRFSAGCILAAAALGAAILSTSVFALEPEETYKVDVILKTTSSEYWGYVEDGAKSYMEDHPNVEVEIKGASNETAYDEMKEIIAADLQDESYDAFVIAPLNEADVVELIAGEKRPVIALDTEIHADEILAFVGTCNEDAARMGAEKAVEKAIDGGWSEINAICISGVEGDNTAVQRLEGYMAGINSAGGTFLEEETVYAEAEAEKAAEAMKAIMEKYPDGVAIIMANNDDMAIAAAKEAKENDAYQNTVFLGFDGIKSACEAILNDEETMSVSQDAYGMGYTAVDAAMTAVGGEMPDEVIYVEHELIDKDNAQARLEMLEGLE